MLFDSVGFKTWKAGGAIFFVDRCGGCGIGVEYEALQNKARDRRRNWFSNHTIYKPQSAIQLD